LREATINRFPRGNRLADPHALLSIGKERFPSYYYYWVNVDVNKLMDNYVVINWIKSLSKVCEKQPGRALTNLKTRKDQVKQARIKVNQGLSS
jgi:hypothetical protein